MQTDCGFESNKLHVEDSAIFDHRLELHVKLSINKQIMRLGGVRSLQELSIPCNRIVCVTFPVLIA